ncbi:hypothetical protein ABT124_44155 [Streptomyces sp. NPDC001982]|uniref:hypothetical protein n=1 Tax=Streptomyces sp. NPDC001982 TaxID=3154405 RepID=UPI003325B65E
MVRTTLTAQLAEAVAGLRWPRTRHGPERLLVDMAVAVGDGASTISEIAVLADQEVVFGVVASWNWGACASSQVLRTYFERPGIISSSQSGRADYLQVVTEVSSGERLTSR